MDLNITFIGLGGAYALASSAEAKHPLLKSWHRTGLRVRGEGAEIPNKSKEGLKGAQAFVSRLECTHRPLPLPGGLQGRPDGRCQCSPSVPPAENQAGRSWELVMFSTPHPQLTTGNSFKLKTSKGSSCRAPGGLCEVSALARPAEGQPYPAPLVSEWKTGDSLQRPRFGCVFRGRLY